MWSIVLLLVGVVYKILFVGVVYIIIIIIVGGCGLYYYYYCLWVWSILLLLLQRQLANVSQDEWLSIPDVGDARSKKQRNAHIRPDRYTRGAPTLLL